MIIKLPKSFPLIIIKNRVYFSFLSMRGSGFLPFFGQIKSMLILKLFRERKSIFSALNALTHSEALLGLRVMDM